MKLELVDHNSYQEYLKLQEILNDDVKNEKTRIVIRDLNTKSIEKETETPLFVDFLY